MYDLSKHRHEFAVWAAARAAFIHAEKDLTTEVARDVLERWVQPRVAMMPDWPDELAEADRTITDWTRRVLTGLQKGQVREPMYGRAAKLVAVYLKETVVNAGVVHPFVGLLHPPIDENLLIALRSEWTRNALFFPNTPQSSQDQLKTQVRCAIKTRWSNLCEVQYGLLIEALRGASLDRDHTGETKFWYLERFWKASRTVAASPPAAAKPAT